MSTEQPTSTAAPAEPNVARVAYPDLGSGVEPGSAVGIDRLSGVELTVTVELGRATMKVRDLLRLGEGSVLELDRTADAPVDILVNGRVIASGEVVVVGDELGVRITSLHGQG